MKIFDTMADMGHEQIAICYDKSSGYRGIIAIHDTTLGPALGGTRVWNYATDEEAITDALRRKTEHRFLASEKHKIIAKPGAEYIR